MADFRFPSHWLTDRRVMTLTGDEFKAFVTAGAWSVENRTDGRVAPEDIEFIPRFPRSCIPRLVAVGLWVPDGDGWLMVDYARTQTSRAEFEVLERSRRADREKKRRLRAHKAGDHSFCDSGCVSPGQSPGFVPGTTQARRGQARRGEAVDSDDSLNVPDFVDWPTATVPAGGSR